MLFRSCAGGEEPGLSDVSIDCLSHHAAMAKSNSNHCALASGAEATAACTSYCSDYCKLAVSRCTGPDNLLFADEATCLLECETLAAAPATSSYDVEHVDENTVQCRIDYLTAIDTTSDSSATTGCAAAAISSSVCAD